MGLELRIMDIGLWIMDCWVKAVWKDREGRLPKDFAFHFHLFGLTDWFNLNTNKFYPENCGHKEEEIKFFLVVGNVMVIVIFPWNWIEWGQMCRLHYSGHILCNVVALKINRDWKEKYKSFYLPQCRNIAFMKVSSSQRASESRVFVDLNVFKKWNSASKFEPMRRRWIICI